MSYFLWWIKKATKNLVFSEKSAKMWYFFVEFAKKTTLKQKLHWKMEGRWPIYIKVVLGALVFYFWNWFLGGVASSWWIKKYTQHLGTRLLSLLWEEKLTFLTVFDSPLSRKHHFYRKLAKIHQNDPNCHENCSKVVKTANYGFSVIPHTTPRFNFSLC